jgi:hypothetical protein
VENTQAAFCENGTVSGSLAGRSSSAGRVLAGGLTSGRLLDSFGSAFNGVFFLVEEEDEDAYRRNIWSCFWTNWWPARYEEYF